MNKPEIIFDDEFVSTRINELLALNIDRFIISNEQALKVSDLLD